MKLWRTSIVLKEYNIIIYAIYLPHVAHSPPVISLNVSVELEWHLQVYCFGGRREKEINSVLLLKASPAG